METVHLKVFRMSEDVKLPEKAFRSDACWDIFAAAEMVLPQQQIVTVPTGLKVEIPVGWELQIRPRSGLASRYGINIVFGTVDSGYRNEIKVMVYNTSRKPFFINKGYKIAQISLEPVYDMKIVEVESEDLLGESERGLAGFGSTGI